MSTIRKTVSMPQIVHEAALEQMKEYGYAEFSDYIQALIRADTGVQPGTQAGFREQQVEPSPSPAQTKKLRRKPNSKVAAAEKKIAEAIQQEAARQNTQPRTEQ